MGMKKILSKAYTYCILQHFYNKQTNKQAKRAYSSFKQDATMSTEMIKVNAFV